MAKIYDYKKIQVMREVLTEEAKKSFPTVTVEVLMLVEQRIQTAIMASLFDDDIRKEVK